MFTLFLLFSQIRLIKIIFYKLTLFQFTILSVGIWIMPVYSGNKTKLLTTSEDIRSKE